MDLLRIGALVVVLLLATYTDLSRRKIYNWITFPAIGFGVGLAGGEVIIHGAWSFLFPCLLSMLACAIVFGLPYGLGWLGGGDFKLLLAVGALQGSPLELPFILTIIYNVSLVGAIMAALLLIWRGKLFKGLCGSLKLLTHPKVQNPSSGETLPYGLAIAMGTLWSITLELGLL